jgi:RimJ/RimL family protein N-acetyltransferase
MIELLTDHIPVARPVFKSMQDIIPLQGVFEQRHPARVFIDQINQPSTAFVWDRWGYFYLAGDPNRPETRSSLQELLEGSLLPASRSIGQSDFILWPDSTAWRAALADVLPGRSLINIFRRTFHFDPATFYEGRYSRPSLPPGFTLTPIDASIIGQHPFLEAEILTAWDTIDAYLEDGVGVCLLEGEQLASVCFSMFVASGAAEVNVFTAKDYRQKGFATLTSAAFIDACLKRKMRPNWECFADNLPSVRLAENLGFKADKDIPVYYWEESSEYANI